MPRYRFAWSNLPPQLLTKLGAALAPGGPPADALRSRFGARPKADFVQAGWPTLLEAWLPNDSPSRQFVAEELYGLGLGRTQIGIRTKRAQLEYLGSCRNAPTLRDVVLEAFLSAGEASQLETPEVRTLPGTIDSSPPIQPSEGEGDTSPGGPSEGTSTAQDEEIAGLNEWIEEVLKEAYGLPVVERDADGDIPLPRGSTVVFVRAHDGESPLLEVYAPLLHGFRMSAEIYEAVNSINTQLVLAKAVVEGDGTLIVLNAYLLTNSLSASELLFAIDLVGDAANHFDTLLQKRFGGNTLMPDDEDSIDV